MSEVALVVLMRWPSPHAGKTRLAGDVGAAAADRIHAAMVADTLGWPEPRPRLLAVAGSRRELRAASHAAPDAVVVPQPPGDLGQRIGAALCAAIRGGAERAVVVGTDSPTLPGALVGDCLELARPGVAGMVPARDGGFVALSLHARDAGDGVIPWLTAGIPWSTELAAAAVRRTARGHGVTVLSTPPWFDVDRGADLPRLRRALLASPERAPHTARCLADLGIAGSALRALRAELPTPG